MWCRWLPLPYTNKGFEVLSAMDNNIKGYSKIQKFLSVWDDDNKSYPLTSELIVQLYGNILN